MGDPIKRCPNPACGSSAIAIALSFSLYCIDCGTRGPRAGPWGTASDGWDALPRHDWRPASDPPDVPEGKWAVIVIAVSASGYVDRVLFYRLDDYSTPGWPPSDDPVTHWMPMPPGREGPGETSDI